MDDIAAVACSCDEALAIGDEIDRLVELSGLSLAHHKSVNACEQMTFLGISFNSQKMTMEVTSERLEAIQAELQLWSDRKKASRREIQSLAGKLQFIAKCCPYGRCFLSRILTALKGLKRASHRVYLNQAFKKDIRWWQLMLPHFNSVSIIKTEPWSDPDQLIATDACLHGAGGTFRDRFFMCEFPDMLKQDAGSISQLEAMTVVIALKLWAHMLKGHRIVIHCDNSATVSVLNTGRAQDGFLQNCAREVIFLACKYQFELKAVHIAGADNRLPDLLSRVCLDSKNFDKFLSSSDVTWKQDIVNSNTWCFSCPW